MECGLCGKTGFKSTHALNLHSSWHLRVAKLEEARKTASRRDGDAKRRRTQQSIAELLDNDPSAMVPLSSVVPFILALSATLDELERVRGL